MIQDEHVTLFSRVRHAWNHWRFEPDPYIRFSIILYLLVFAGVLHIIVMPTDDRMEVAPEGTLYGYLIWKGLGLLSPVLYLLQWLIRISGKRYLGLTIRLVADILLSTTMWSVWVARENAAFPYADVNVFTNYVFVGVSIFALTLVARDIWVLFFRKGP